jgi:acid phosphatase
MIRPVSSRLAASSAPALAALLLLTGAGCRSGAPAAAPAAVVETAPEAVADPCAARLDACDGLDGVLWFQTAEEARQLQRQAFLAARRALDQALADPAWSALGQGGEAAALPVAVIADVDETLLDNSPFEGWMLRSGRQFNPADWTSWVDAAEARPLAGAVEFARYAAERGVTLFYVTNRDAEHEAATLENLRREGFPLRDDLDVLLLRGERPEWTSDKQGRRDLVAAGFRVVLLLGDDLNDFLTGVYDATPERRAELAAGAADRFGTSWFLLPNPHYGSWKRAIGSGMPPSSGPEETRARKLARLRAFR